MITKDNYIEYFKNNMDTLVYGGVRLEGYIATLGDTRDVINGRIPEHLDAKTIKIIQNIYRAWKFIFNYFDIGDDIRYPRVIKEFHSILAKDVADYVKENSYIGKLRDFEVSIGKSSYKPPVMLGNQFEEDLSRLLNTEDTIDGILYVYIHLMRQQYFANTNKRTAYLFTNLLLLVGNHGYLLSLPVSKESIQTFMGKVLEFYENPKKGKSLILYIKRFYLKKVV